MIKVRDLSIRNKILLFIGLSFLLTMLGLAGIVIFQFEKLADNSNETLKEILLNKEKERVKHAVQIMANNVAKIYRNNEDKLSTRELQQLISNQNKGIEFGQTGYFYIFDYQGKVIGHGATPSLIGQNLRDLKSENQYIVRELTKAAEKGGGFVSYFWENPKNKKIEKKIGYVEPIVGTNLWVGSGTYQSVINNYLKRSRKQVKEIGEKTLYSLLFMFVLTILIIGVIIFKISKYLSKNIDKILVGLQRVSQGDLSVSVEVESEDELGQLAVGFNQMVEKIDNLTYNDPLTGLPNELYFRDKISLDLEKLSRTEDGLVLFALGFDRLKNINDSYGHQIGDQLLEKIAMRLRNFLDDEIVLSRKREEFFFYAIENDVVKSEILEQAQEILYQIGQPYNIEGELIYITSSVGISTYPDNGVDGNLLIQNSGLALHLAKDENTKIHFYDSTMVDKLSQRMTLESKLRVAIEKQEFILHYQPFISSETGEIVGMEALIRWDHPNEGMISPGKFIPLAEDTGMIIEIGDWVLEEACYNLKDLHRLGYDELYISVNIAPQQFKDDDFIEKIEETLAVTGLSPKYLELEITERTAVEDVQYTINLLYKLNEIGVRIAIDDFGTGYSSLSFLKEFAIDVLKIDQSFIDQLNKDPKNRAIAETIIIMGHNLDLEVVAEGVETKEELEFLEEKECDILQGYFFSKPLAQNDFIELLNKYERYEEVEVV